MGIGLNFWGLSRNWNLVYNFRVGYVYIEKSFDTTFNMGYEGGGASTQILTKILSISLVLGQNEEKNVIKRDWFTD